MQGWIKVHRKMLDSESLNKLTRAERWCFLEILCSATHIDYEYSDLLFSTVLKRGEQVFSIKEWSKEWGLTYNQTNYLLHRFEKLGLISMRNERHRIILTIQNYSKYQSKNDFSRTIEEVSKNFSRTFSDKTIDNIEEIETPPENFQEVFKNYSRSPQNHLYIQEAKEAKNNIYISPEVFSETFNENEIDEIINNEADEFVEKVETEILHQPKKEIPEEAVELAKVLYDEIIARRKIPKPNFKKWGVHIERLKKKWELTYDEIKNAIVYSQRIRGQPETYPPEIESTKLLFEKFEKLMNHKERNSNAGIRKNNKPKFDRETIAREHDEMSELINKSEVFKNNKGGTFNL